jgi:hypothetical protein
VKEDQVNKTSMVVIALAFGGAIAGAYGAQFPGAPESWVVASADTKDVQSAGGHSNEPGQQNDPASAEKGGQPTGGAVKAAGPHPEEPGISGDPVSAEKKATSAGGDVKAAGGHPEEPGRSNDPASAEKVKK